jgi:cardiolipin synthase
MNVLQWVLLIVIILVALATACHALLYKRDPRAALGWIAVCLLYPLVGPILYFLFGINRVRTRAKKLHRHWQFPIYIGYERPENEDVAVASNLDVPREVKAIARISDAITRRSLVGGNTIELLHNGEQVYPAMLDSYHACPIPQVGHNYTTFGRFHHRFFPEFAQNVLIG